MRIFCRTARLYSSGRVFSSNFTGAVTVERTELMNSSILLPPELSLETQRSCQRLYLCPPTLVRRDSVRDCTSARRPRYAETVSETVPVPADPGTQRQCQRLYLCPPTPVRRDSVRDCTCARRPRYAETLSEAVPCRRGKLNPGDHGMTRVTSHPSD